MRRRQISAVALSLVAVVLGIGASVATASEPPKAGFGGMFELQATHGFKVVGLIGAKGPKAELTLFVGRARERATYLVRGTREGEELDFDLGPLGKVEVEAQLTGRMETVRPACG